MNSVTRTISGYVYTFANLIIDSNDNVTMAGKQKYWSNRKLGERAITRIKKELGCNTLVSVEEVCETRTMPIEVFIANSTVVEAEED